MNTPTPGPWEVRDINEHKRGWRIARRDPDCPTMFAPEGDIAHVYMKGDALVGDDGSGEANGYLLAAAPELKDALAALSVVAGTILKMHSAGIPVEDSLWENLFQKAAEGRVALAMATRQAEESAP